MTAIRNSDDLLLYLKDRAESGDKAWFSFMEQRVTGIPLAHRIAANHADKMSPDEVADYVVKLNRAIYNKIIVGK